MANKQRSGLIIALFPQLATFASAAFADVTPATIIGSNMVVQRGQVVPIWGTASPGERVSVSFAEQRKSGVADGAGRWRVDLEPLEASGKPRAMTIRAANTITLSNILVGEVWLASGQSNMAYGMGVSIEAGGFDTGTPSGATAQLRAHMKSDLQSAAAADLRLFRVQIPLPGETAPQEQTTWQAVTTETLKPFSAVAYYFAREIHEKLGVPVGIVEAAQGGTPIELWMPYELPEPKVPLPAVVQRPDILGAMFAMPIGTLFKQHVVPLIPFAIRGAIWYQGESNVLIDDRRYAAKMRVLIEGWRDAWHQRELPVYYVQLAPFDYIHFGPPGAATLDSLPRLWEQQSATLSLPDTGMAVTTDLVENIRDVHPTNKWEVGRRLALIALAKTYGHADIVYSGPSFKSARLVGNKIEVSFDHVGGGLTSRDGKPLTDFTIAGSDGVFVPAGAVIEGDKVFVSSTGIGSPTEVRFAWSQTAQPNFFNREGLPALPFRTDRD